MRLDFDFNDPVVTNEVWHIIRPKSLPTKTNHEKKVDISYRLFIYPNPTNANITIDTKKFNDFTLRVLDLNDKILESKFIPENKDSHELSLQKYADGLYFIHITNKDGLRFYGKVFKH